MAVEMPHAIDGVSVPIDGFVLLLKKCLPKRTLITQWSQLAEHFGFSRLSMGFPGQLFAHIHTIVLRCLVLLLRLRQQICY